MTKAVKARAIMAFRPERGSADAKAAANNPKRPASSVAPPAAHRLFRSRIQFMIAQK
jgi:hypothetical protein